MTTEEDKPRFHLSEEAAARATSASRNVEAHFDKIQQYLERGVKRQVVLDALNAMGPNLSMAGFATALKRIRKRRKLEATSPEGQPVKVVPVKAAETTNEASAVSENLSFHYNPHSDVSWERPEPEKEST
jgi:hypothetical protein